MSPGKTDPEEETAVNTSSVSEEGVEGASIDNEHDPYFEPVVFLPEIHVYSNEEQEEEMITLRCKLFRYNTLETPAEWMERGIGDVKILQHSEKKTLIRVLMRQDKTLKIRANHYITPFMELKPNCGSDRAWVWSVPADFADEEPKQELFAIRFANAENARLFQEKFNEAKDMVTVAEVKQEEKECESTTETPSAAADGKEEEARLFQEKINEAKDMATVAEVKQEENECESTTETPSAAADGKEEEEVTKDLAKMKVSSSATSPSKEEEES